MSKSWLKTDNEYSDLGPLFSGQVLRDEGIKTVTEHNESWMVRCLNEAEDFIKCQSTTFTGEDVRFHCQCIIGEPGHPNAWGALINTLSKRKIIRATGQYVQPKDKTSHARAIQVYEKI